MSLPLSYPVGHAGRFFNATPRIDEVEVGPGQFCYVVDDALIDPEGLVAWADRHRFEPAEANAYPGRLMDCVPTLEQSLDGFFTHHIRRRLGARRTVGMYARFSLVTLAPAALQPGQWQCHRDRVAIDPALCAASVLYLFRDVRLGGTAFYRPRCTAVQLERMLGDAQALGVAEFSARYGVGPGYMTASNDHFEQTGHVPAAWNRLVFYDGGQFHSGHIAHPELLSDGARHGRLTLNGFFACRRGAS
ncbi:DUF6445 family protein [Roseateles saccharophilus]|uniref:Uncharacterized protein n=1 Tax=Roseateles saccharophilus TaxID=304 RepID=A0A4R3V5W8_ROSSA|nr:DUF6445 family protein [Roseateles saccharophilus]MDG0835016.1 hypothetical protein [Roseateles saccharophilus]TCV00397.1 hypothetical protein EV671_1008152 [Roseateles saccharophilus]